MMSLLDLIRQSIGQVLTWWVIVAPWEQALRVRAGKRTAVLGAGIYLRIPFIDVVYRQTVRRRPCTLPTQTMTTADGKTLTIGAVVGYSINDIRKLYDTLHDADATLVNMTASAIAREVAGRRLEDCSPATIAELASNHLRFEKYGLSAGVVQITDWAVIRAYRLISDQRWVQNAALDVHAKE